MSSGFKIRITNVKIKNNRVYTTEPYTSVSDKLKRGSSKKVKVKRR